MKTRRGRFLSDNVDAAAAYLDAARRYASQQSGFEREWLHRKPFDPRAGNEQFYLQVYAVMNLLRVMEIAPGGRVLEVGSGPGWVSELLQRVEASGYKAVALTVDTQHYSRRERDILARWSPRKAMEIAPNPRGPFHDYQMRLTWSDVEWLMKTTKLPVGLKGIMTVADARRAVETGVRLIWVSNHGGRQLDHTQSSIEALPPIVEAVAGRAEIVVDGGFSRGTDVLKGLARGARVVMIGRTALWGLAADGAEGVARVFEIVRDQLHVAMGLCGRTKISDLKPDLIFRAD